MRERTIKFVVERNRRENKQEKNGVAKDMD